MIKIIIDTLLKSRGFTEYRNKKKIGWIFGDIHPIHVFFVRKIPKPRYRFEKQTMKDD